MELIELNAIIPEELDDMRLDAALATLFQDYSRSQLQAWIKQGFVNVDGAIETQQRKKVFLNQSILIKAEPTAQENWEAQEIPLDIIFEDESLIILNKPAGLVVHPGAGNNDQTLVNALLHHCPALKNIPRAGLVHRIDKDTTGLLVIAKTLESHHHLTQAIQEKKITREYRALVFGELISGGTINAPMGRHHVHRTKMAVRKDGKLAVTHYRVLKKFKGFTYLKINLETGRTHQIRVHMSHIKHPIIGDQTYFDKNRISAKLPDPLQQALKKFPRQALHAARLELTHPKTGEVMSWEVDIPKDFKLLLNMFPS